MGEDLGRAFVSFFAIIDPVGNVVVFHLIARRMAFGAKLQVATVSVLAAAAMLVVFALAGTEVLDFLGISTDSFKVAAGLLLLPPAFSLVTRGQSMEPEEESRYRPFEMALVPLATPLLAGPGALAAAISFSDTLGSGTTVLGLSLVLLLTFLVFLAAASLFQWLGEPVIRVLSRIVGILLFAIAIDFILEGTRAFFDA